MCLFLCYFDYIFICKIQVQPEDVTKLAETEIPPTTEFREDFAKLSFIPRSLTEHDTILVRIRRIIFRYFSVKNVSRDVLIFLLPEVYKIRNSNK